MTKSLASVLLGFLGIFVALSPLQAKNSSTLSKGEARKELIQKLEKSSREIAASAEKKLRPPDQKESYRALALGVKMLKKDKNSELNSAVLKFAGEVAYKDRSGKVGELLLPFWKVEARRFLKHTEELSEPKRRELRRQLKAALTASRNSSR